MGLLTKLNAWWRRARRDAAPAPVARPLRSPTRTGLESEQPLDGLTLAQWLWGAGCHTPGDEDHILDLVKPFALNPAMSMLYLGAGLGGGARAIATKFATYVTALERDATLARRGMEMSTLQGMQKACTGERLCPRDHRAPSGVVRLHPRPADHLRTPRQGEVPRCARACAQAPRSSAAGGLCARPEAPSRARAGHLAASSGNSAATLVRCAVCELPKPSRLGYPSDRGCD